MGAHGWTIKDHSTNLGNILFGVGVALSVVQIVLVAARFYARYLQRVRCGVDDYVILIALMGSIAKTVIFIALIKSAGLGHHIDEFNDPAQKVALIRKGFYILEILDFPLTVTPAKISLLIFYARIFPVRKFQICSYVLGSFVLALGIAILFQTIFQCSPISYGWDRSIDNGSCIHQMVFYRAVSPLNVLTGVLILVLPMPLVWRLHAPRGQKLALTGVFLLGGLGTLASILRMATYFTNKTEELHDVTWFSVRLGIWAVLESAVIIIAACLISIWPLVTRVVPRSLLAALSCHLPRARQHRGWYLRTAHAQPQTREEFTSCGKNRTPTDDSLCWSSPPSSLADLVDQRLWIFDEENPPPRRVETVMASNPKTFTNND